jgi:hypothetical protein
MADGIVGTTTAGMGRAFIGAVMPGAGGLVGAAVGDGMVGTVGTGATITNIVVSTGNAKEVSIASGVSVAKASSAIASGVSVAKEASVGSTANGVSVAKEGNVGKCDREVSAAKEASVAAAKSWVVPAVAGVAASRAVMAVPAVATDAKAAVALGPLGPLRAAFCLGRSQTVELRLSGVFYRTRQRPGFLNKLSPGSPSQTKVATPNARTPLPWNSIPSRRIDGHQGFSPWMHVIPQPAARLSPGGVFSLLKSNRGPGKPG